MRRLVRVPLAALAATALVVTPVLAGTSAAAPGEGRPAVTGSEAKTSAGTGVERGRAKPAAKPTAKPTAKPAAAPRGAKRKVVVVGVVTATATVTTSGTSTVLVTLKSQGGDKEYRGRTVRVTVDAATVVKRNHGKRTRYELQVGDKVVVHARRAADGALTATYVAASGRPRPVPSSSPATSTATTSSTS